MNKPIRIGYGVIRDEETCILGWARTLNVFCENIYAIVDPNTTDKTIEILKKEAPYVNIIFQDRSLGDSDNEVEGKTHSLIMHNNLTKFAKDNLKEGEWTMMLAADERFPEHQLQQLANELKYAKIHDYDSISHIDIYEPVALDKNQMCYKERSWYFKTEMEKENNTFPMNFRIPWRKKWGFAQKRFIKYNADWKHNSLPHHGTSEFANPFTSTVPLYHFHRIKHDEFKSSNWRDEKGAVNDWIKMYRGISPLTPIYVPFENWEKMDELNNFTLKKIKMPYCKDLKEFNEKHNLKFWNFMNEIEKERLEYLKLQDLTFNKETKKKLYEYKENLGLIILPKQNKILDKETQERYEYLETQDYSEFTEDKWSQWELNFPQDKEIIKKLRSKNKKCLI